jgi:acyl-CoA thioester hydrolase
MRSGQTWDVDLTDRGTFRYWSQEKVRWGDQDGARHINNVAYATYFEDARLDLMLAKVIPHKGKGDNFIVRRVAIEYLGTAAYPNDLEIGSCVADIGSSSFTIGQGVFLGDRCLATGETVHVHLRERKPFPLTDELRAVLEAERPG